MNHFIKINIMHKLQKVFAGALFLTAPVAATASLYIAGPGAPAGTDNPVEMTDIGGNTYVTVCYLDNVDGKSFRVQENQDKAYGPSSDGFAIVSGNPQGVEQSGNYFSVGLPGVYFIKAALNENKVEINRMSDLYLIGDGISGVSWDLSKAFKLHIADEGDASVSVYSGIVPLVMNGDAKGSFKIAVDPANGRGFDSRFFLFRGDKSHFTTDPEGDRQWSIGWPDMDNHANDPDLTPGNYLLKINTGTKGMEFYRRPSTVSIAGPGALAAWENVATNPSLADMGEGNFSASHIYFTPDGEFKVVIDGVYYGSDSWQKTQLTDEVTSYLRQVSDGADLHVATPGFRKVTVAPSVAGDGTLSLTLSAPEAVWVEGICAMSYDEVSGRWLNTGRTFSWMFGGIPYEFKAGGEVIATITPSESGWYIPSVSVVDGKVKCDIGQQNVTVSRDNESPLSFESWEAADDSYFKKRVYLKAGEKLTPEVGDLTGETVTAVESGFYNITMIFDRAKNAPVLSLAGPVEVHMPLTEADFADGKTHYFLVGQRMGAWRLQPEWELLPVSEDTYALPGRLLYNGYVMVGAVDNYDDYIAQTYRAYSFTDTDHPTVVDPRHGGTDVDREFALKQIFSSGTNGCIDGKFTGTRYNDLTRTAAYRQHGGWDALANNALNVLDPTGHGDQEHIQSMPSRVSAIRLKTDGNGQPVRLTFEGLNTSALEVARLRTFSLVGGGIRNHKVTYDDNRSTTPLNHQDGYHGEGWSDAWIQYDAKAKPYVDAFGEFIYQTSFTRDWLRAHPCYFNFNNSTFEYTSNNITFNYDPDRQHPDQFGNHKREDDDLKRDEVLYTYFDCPDEKELRNNIRATHNLDDEMTVAASNRACFVLEDVWMEGLFKVWSGWGGSATNCEYDDNGTTHTRWFLSNAGHGAWQDDRAAFYTAGKIMAYTLFEDMDAANFGIGYGPLNNDNDRLRADGSILDEYKDTPERRYFRRIEIWFNLNNGFAYKGKTDGASFILFYQRRGAPNISAEKHNANQLKYTFNIPLVNDMPSHIEQEEFGNVIHYEIYRIAIDAAGNEVLDPTPVEKKDVDLPREQFSYIGVVDPKKLQPGRYRYEVRTVREKNPDAVQTAKSNILAITDEVWDPTGIEEVGMEAAPAALHVATDGTGRLEVSSSAEIGRLEIYSVSGRLGAAARIGSTSGSVDISALPSGVYIVKTDNATARFIKR